MALSDLFSRLGRPSSRGVEASVRAIVHEVLKEQGYASPSEVQALRDEAARLAGRIDTLDRRLGDLAKLTEEARATAARAEHAPPSADPRVAELDARLALLAEELEALRSARPAAEAGAAAAAPLQAAARGACKVEGCGGPVRSKGFCSAHYQQWRRGTLAGFVGLDGAVEVDGQVFHVDPDFAGHPASLRHGKLHVDGAAVG